MGHLINPFWGAASGPPTGMWNPLDAGNNVVLSNGNKTATGTVSGANVIVRSTIPHSSTGKYYAEGVYDLVSHPNNRPQFGILSALTGSLATAGNLFSAFSLNPGWNISLGNSPDRIFTQEPGNATQVAFATVTPGSVFMLAVNFATGQIWFGRAGTWFSGNPALGTGADYTSSTISGGTPFCLATCGISNTPFFAQLTGRFTRSELTYSVPTGFLAWDGT